MEETHVLVYSSPLYILSLADPYSVALPAIILAGMNAKNLWDEHWEHWATLPPLEERVQYPYMNVRTKAYPWGDGDKVCIPLHFLHEH